MRNPINIWEDKGGRIQGTVVDSRLYVLAIAVFLLGLLIRQPLLLACGLLLVLIFGITDIWAKYCFRDLRYQRQLSQQRVLFGEEITLSVIIENAKMLPLPWLEVDDTLPAALSIKGRTLRSVKESRGGTSVTLECLFSPSWYERVTRRYTMECKTRGVFTFGPTSLRSGDAFGFVNREIELENWQFVLVYPLIVPLSSFHLPSRHPFGERRAPRRLLEDPSRVVGVRDYAYGDSMRRVNWKASARAMQLQSKVYEASTTYTLGIFLNAAFHSETHYGIYPELQELAICAAASVADWALNEGYAVGLYSNTRMFMPDSGITISTDQGEIQPLSSVLNAELRRREIRITPSLDKDQRVRIMEALARIQSYFGSGIEEVLEAERLRLPQGASVVVITSSLGELLIDTLLQMQRRGYMVSILFVGSSVVPAKMGGIPIYYLGDESTWEQFRDAHTQTELGSPERQATSFHL